MERTVITWGYIPKNNKVEMILTGDAETSGTKELSFEIIDNECNGLDNDFNVKLDDSQLWNHQSSFYNSISKHISAYFDFKIKASNICGAYLLVQDEPDDHSINFQICDSEAGVFNNTNQEHNGKVYLRYYFEEDEEILEEIICVGTLDI